MKVRIGTMFLATMLAAFAQISNAQTPPTSWGPLDFLLGD